MTIRAQAYIPQNLTVGIQTSHGQGPTINLSPQGRTSDWLDSALLMVTRTRLANSHVSELPSKLLEQLIAHTAAWV